MLKIRSEMAKNDIELEISSSSSDALATEDSFSSPSDEYVSGCYLKEPEYSQVEIEKLQKLHECELSENSSSDEEGNSSRLENWCKFSCCVIYNTFKLVECKCCRELNDKLNYIKCITMNNELEILCLNRIVLETASIRHHRYHKNFKELSNYSNK